MTRSSLPTLLVSALLASGCAATIPAELANARFAYQTASQGPAAELVPAELYKARQALDAAEVAFEDEPRGFATLDLAYVAQRKAELAEALAAQAVEARRGADADAQYQATQDAIMRNTRAELGSTRTDLEASRTAVAQGAANLSNAEAAKSSAEAARASAEADRASADTRADAALAALARLATTVREEPRGLVITLSGSVLFRSDEATLLPAARTRLAEVSTALLASPERSLLVEGHTDAQGTDEHNLDLSQRRADAVRAYLIERGYEATRIRAVGVGESRPAGENETTEGRANNRRVEIVVLPMVATAP